MFKNNFKKFSDKIYPDRFINYFLKPDYYFYKDNSYFIEKVFENNFTELILCPDNYGKTFNLETFKYFVSSNSLIDERVDKSMRLEFFKKSKLFSTEFFNEHFAKYPVILINFKELDQRNHKDNMEKFKSLVTLQFEQVLQYLNKEELKANLTSIDVRAIEEYFSNYKNYNENMTINTCKDLCKILLKITKQNPFLIIDDYDYPLVNAFKHGFYSDMLTFMLSFNNITLKNNNFTNKCLLTGVNLIDEATLFSQVSNGNVNIFNYDDVKSKYYGFFELNNDHDHNHDHNPNQSYNDNHNQADFIPILPNLVMSALKSENYMEGFKFLSELTSNNLSLTEMNNDSCHKSIDLSANTRYTPKSIFTYLYYNGLIGNVNLDKILKHILPMNTLEDPYNFVFDYNRKLGYTYYMHFYTNSKIEMFLEYVKNVFKFVSNNLQSKNPASSGLLPDHSLSFRNEDEFDTFLIDIFTLHLSNDTKDHIQIFSIDDDDNTKISKELKKFTLITYHKKNFAVFIKGNKLKKPETLPPKLTETKKEIDELMNNPNISQVTLSETKPKLFQKKVPMVDMNLEMKKANEMALESLDKQEAIKFLLKISAEFEKVFFVSVSTYQRKLDYLVDIVNLVKE